MYKILKTREEFNELVKSTNLTIVDFYATWCGPCRMLAPELEDLASEYEEINVLKVDVDEIPELAGIYNIRAVPTMIFFKEGKMLYSVSGYMDKETILDITKQF